MAITAEQRAQTGRVGHLPLSGLSVLLALVLAIWEIYFFWGAGRNLFGVDGTLGFFTPDRLGFNMAWLTLGYLGFQLISIPFAVTYREQIFGVLDGLASVAPSRWRSSRSSAIQSCCKRRLVGRLLSCSSL